MTPVFNNLMDSDPEFRRLVEEQVAVRRRVRQRLAERSRVLLDRYRRDEPVEPASCPLQRGLAAMLVTSRRR